jgi:hypothetical protein
MSKEGMTDNNEVFSQLRKCAMMIVDKVFENTGVRLSYDKIVRSMFTDYIERMQSQLEIELDKLILKDPKVADELNEYMRRHGGG